VEYYQAHSLKESFKLLDTTLRIPYKSKERSLTRASTRSPGKPPGRPLVDNLYTDDVPVPGPHIRSGTTRKKSKKKKRDETFRRATAGPWQEASDPARSDGPYETWSHEDSGEEAELVMCDGEM